MLEQVTGHQQNEHTRYRVGELILDTGTHTVTRDGQPLDLPHLSYDLLLALVRAAPNLLSHDELMDQVWGDVVVSPETLTQRVKLVRPVMAEEQANLNGIARSDIANTLLEGFQGRQVGIYREGDLLLPVIMRAEERERSSIESINHLQIWSPAAEAMIPLRQVVSGFETVFEDDIIERRNRKPTITVYADPDKGLATSLYDRVAPQVEALELPPGYELEWGGEYEDSGNAQAGLTASLPVFFLSMVLITIMLFNSLKQPLIIWLTVPLAVIGVTAGLLLSNQPFGFMSLLGILSLSGMLIKNAIVLIDEINLQRSEGKALLPAIMDSGVSRLRPVGMAASTTALGMIPLLFDAFFVAMAITIIAGLMFATLLTMVFVPVLYATFYNEQQAGDLP